MSCVLVLSREESLERIRSLPHTDLLQIYGADSEYVAVTGRRQCGMMQNACSSSQQRRKVAEVRRAWADSTEILGASMSLTEGTVAFANHLLAC
ncbi:hypothetical protein KC325_g215 [Hortaea werneckii]|nr:hypothetical protein KC325_g215 [Hortaea werneckii]